MRKQQEIKQAISALRKQGDDISLIQAQTLADGLTERQVFQKYVVEKADDERDEKTFFAARDAARYAAGRLELSELMISTEETSEIEVQEEATQASAASDEEMIQVPIQTFRSIMSTLKELEEQVCSLYGMNSTFNPAAINDLIERNDVLEYIGCGAATLRRWVRTKVIVPYRKGSFTYFSKYELDSNPKIQRYKNSKSFKEA